MNKKIKTLLWSMRVCRRLMWRDWSVFWPTFSRRVFNTIMWIVVSTVVFEYIGLGDGGQTVGLFMACANAANWGFFEIMENVDTFIDDLQSKKSITYALTLPLPQWMVFCRVALSNALQGGAIAFFILPLSKLFMWNSFSFTQMSVGKFLLIFSLSQLFYGFFSLWLICMVKNMSQSSNIWYRVIFPMWYLGCYQFSWATLMQKAPGIASVSLLVNPLVYCIEGTRASVMGQEGFLPFWWCCAALVFFTVLVGTVGIVKMKQKLDCL